MDRVPTGSTAAGDPSGIARRISSYLTRDPGADLYMRRELRPDLDKPATRQASTGRAPSAQQSSLGAPGLGRAPKS
jgi:hypothetical protein